MALSYPIRKTKSSDFLSESFSNKGNKGNEQKK